MDKFERRIFILQYVWKSGSQDEDPSALVTRVVFAVPATTREIIPIFEGLLRPTNRDADNNTRSSYAVVVYIANGV